MKTVTAVVLLVPALCATSARAQLVDDSLGARQKLAEAGYRYDDTASLLSALQDENETVAGFATTFLAEQRATPEIIGALRAAGGSPLESVALGAFSALQRLGATGWEGSASGLMQGTRDDIMRLELAGILAKAGRSEGWAFVKAALSDPGLMVHAVRAAAHFDGLKTPDGEVDAVAEIERIRDQAQGAPFKLYEINASVQQVHARRQKAPRKSGE